MLVLAKVSARHQGITPRLSVDGSGDWSCSITLGCYKLYPSMKKFAEAVTHKPVIESAFQVTEFFTFIDVLFALGLTLGLQFTPSRDPEFEKIDTVGSRKYCERELESVVGVDATQCFDWKWHIRDGNCVRLFCQSHTGWLCFDYHTS